MTRFSREDHRHRRVSLLALLLCALTTTLVGCGAASSPKPPDPVALPALDVPVDAYVQASRRGPRSTVTGTVYEERRKPDAPDEPLAGTVVTLLPYSEIVRTRLETMKRGARESADKYVAAAAQMKKLREAYEAALWDHGAADLVFTAAIAPDGSFRFDDVPAGRWLLYATTARFNKREGRARGAGDRRFPQERRFEGFYDVTVWLRDLSTGRTAPDDIDLTDRNVWFSGVAEEWLPRPRPPLTTGPR